MATHYATSADGVEWVWHGQALGPRPGEWDSRGVRVSTVRFGATGEIVAYYDGRATAEENYEERTGVAVGESPAALTAIGPSPSERRRMALAGFVMWISSTWVTAVSAGTTS